MGAEENRGSDVQNAARVHLKQWAQLVNDAHGVGSTAWDSSAVRRALRWGAQTEQLVASAYDRGEKVVAELLQESIIAGLIVAGDEGQILAPLRNARRTLLTLLLGNSFVCDEIFETALASYYDEFPESAAKDMEEDLETVVRTQEIRDATSTVLAILQDPVAESRQGNVSPTLRAAGRLLWQRIFHLVQSFYMKEPGRSDSATENINLMQEIHELLDTVAATPKEGFDLVLVVSSLGPFRKNCWKQSDPFVHDEKCRNMHIDDAICTRETQKAVLKWWLRSPIHLSRLRRQDPETHRVLSEMSEER
eukprot:m.560089 g.560089  ORF g.560089 m.560089 type:complete len:307 (-) comp22209_c0_seq14:578-1498(-)